MLSAGDFEPIYDPSVGEAEAWYINDHTIFRDHTGTWHLIGITHAEPMAPFEEVHLAHATAPSLHGPWTKEPYALTADPEHGETQLWAPHVVHHDGTYWMYFCAGGASKSEYRIHLATSTDAWTWTRHPANPLLVDGFEARDPMVLRVGDRWVLFYTATSEPDGGQHVVAAAESDDLVHWSGRRIVYTDPMSGTMAGPTESPFVFEHDGRWFLLIGPDWDGLTRSFEAVLAGETVWVVGERSHQRVRGRSAEGVACLFVEMEPRCLIDGHGRLLVPIGQPIRRGSGADGTEAASRDHNGSDGL